MSDITIVSFPCSPTVCVFHGARNMFSKFERFFKSIKNTRNEMPKKQLAPFIYIFIYIYFATSPTRKQWPA